MHTLFDIIIKSFVSFVYFSPFLYACYKLQQDYVVLVCAIWFGGMLIALILGHKTVDRIKNI
jgi:hypothetical protein